MRITVDLPAPLSPVSATHSPGATVKARTARTGIATPPWLCSVKDLEVFDVDHDRLLTPAARN
jgi:hypothetical protein